MQGRSRVLTCGLLAAAAATSCASATRRFPLREAMWRDTDLRPVHVPCRPDPEEEGHQLCRPEDYTSPFAWDGADNMLFRPMSQFFAVDPEGPAINVNAMDEVPDSAWFTNRIGMQPMTADQIRMGSCDPAELLDPDAPDGSWEIDMGKPNGANPGFRIRVNGVKFMLKADPSDQPERATGATSIAARFYYAAGWWAPCDSVVYFRPSILRLRPGLEVTDNSGVTRPFNQAALDRLLANASYRETADGGRLIRMVASRWLPGRAIGPFRYEGTRDDDPNDVIPHEERRDLRGAKVIAAWLNHFDSREQNSMDTWMPVNTEDSDSSPGHVRHWYIDLGDCFGSEWAYDGISRRLGHAYYLDVPYVVGDFLTLGLVRRPWDRARRAPEARLFGYYHERDFAPEDWHGGYPNPAFSRMTEGDGAWATRILARFTPDLIRAAISVGNYTSPRHVRYLETQVIARHRRVLRRYLAVLSPITDVEATEDRLCAVDLARRTGVFGSDGFTYSASVFQGADHAPGETPSTEPGPDGRVCVSLRHHAASSGTPDDHASRYTIVDLHNGRSEGPTRVHLYDLGPTRGFRVVGIERPDDLDPPTG